MKLDCKFCLELSAFCRTMYTNTTRVDSCGVQDVSIRRATR